MKRILFLFMTIAVVTIAAMAADVDLTTAQNAARSFMARQVAGGRLRAPAATNLTLAKAEASVVKPEAVDYYIFNAEKSYVVVAGDDQAPEILMYGEEGKLDLNNIPPAMQWLLNKYKYQIDGLKAGTLKANGYAPRTVAAVAPMVTANWDQSAPYYNQCPTSGSRRAVTGCPATSLAMCYYKWKWPKTFPACAAISSSSSGGYSAAALPERAADWDNIIDEYTGPSNTSYNTTQANAVAWLMRYAGQSIPDYMYGYDASGAEDPEIYQGVLNMGYTNAQLLTLTTIQSGWTGYSNSSQNYTDAQWNEWMLAELQAGRPIEYLACDITNNQVSGHAFNVFGCNASGQYYVNWGWSGDSNGYCTLHNFTTATSSTGQSGGSYVFKYGEAMIIGIAPPAGALGPQLSVNSNEVSFTTAGQQKIIALTGSNLTNDVTVTLNDPSDAFNLSVAGLNSNAPSAVMRNANATMTIPAASISEDNPVNIIVTLKQGMQGTFNATVTLASDGAESVTVALNAAAGVEETGGTASDAYLNIAKYATIDEAGWNTTATGYVTKFYEYTEYPNDGVAWLTMPVFGAWCGHRYPSNNGPQKWIKYNRDSSNDAYSTIGAVKTAWSAADIYKGSAAYFNGKDVRRFGVSSTNASTEYAITFYVTNCSGIKLNGNNNNSNRLANYPTTLKVYECTKNANGTLNEGTTTITGGNLSNTTSRASLDFNVSGLDTGKIYKVVASLYRAQFCEIAFQTPLTLPETPVIISADPAATTADVTWVSGDNNDGWNLRYRPYEEPTMETLFWDFPVGDDEYVVTDGWGTSLDYDGDGHDWGLMATDGDETTDPTDACWFSESYVNGTGAVNPDNWLISPEITFGGQISFYAWGVDSSWAAEVFNVLVAPSSAIEGTSVYTNQFESITPDITVTGTKTKYTFDLSAYQGTGYVVIQHHNVTDQYRLAIDDIEVIYPVSSTTQSEWIYVNDVTSPYTIEGLTPETTYEVQVQGTNANYGASAWTPSTLFTTLNGVGTPEIVSAEPTTTTSEVTWTAGDQNVDWNLRYREYVEGAGGGESTLWDLPLDSYQTQMADFSVRDADGDGNNWGVTYFDEEHTNICFYSESYDGTNDLTPDNWLYTREVELGGTLKFKAALGQLNWPDKIGVYVLPTDDEYYYHLGDVTPQTESLVEYQFDLSQYQGMGQIAFRHYESDGNVAILLDDIEVITAGAQPGEWIYVNNVTSPYTITGLTPETTYEVQVQGVGDGGYTSAWTPSTLFTTLGVEEVTLATLEGQRDPGATYTISDQLLVVRASGNKLWAKDANNSIARRDKPEGQIDYMREVAASGTYAINNMDVTVLNQEGEWDQSNWVVIEFLNSEMTPAVLADYEGKYIASVTGIYSDGENYTIQVPASTDKNTVDSWIGEVATPAFTPNVYCAANFLSSNLTDAGVTSPHGKVYFFMTPKVQEVFTVTYAVYAGNNKFTLPASEHGMNAAGLHGAFTVDMSYNGGTADLVVGQAYQFTAVASKPVTGGSGAPRKINGTGDNADGSFVVMPLDLSGNGNIVTKVGDVKVASREVVGVQYVNAAGISASKPFDGVNMVVTRYSDGSTTVEKRVF